MKKRFITLILSVVLCFTAAFGVTGCADDKPFTITFYASQDGAYLAREYLENVIYGDEIFVDGTNEDEVESRIIYEIKFVGDDTIYHEKIENEKYITKPVEWVRQTVNSAKEIIEPIFLHDNAWHNGWTKSIRRLTSSAKVSATWSDQAFTVTFEPGAYDATLVSGELEQLVCTPSKIEFPKWTRVGYEMDDKWSHYDTADINGNCTLTPKWIPNKYTVSFVDKNGETLFEPKEVEYGKAIGDLPTPQKDGEKFGAWRIWSEDFIFIFEDKIYDFTEDVVLQAVWMGGNGGLIRYIDVGGSYGGSIEYPYGEDYSLVEPTKTGYIFDGWSGTGIDGKVKEYTIPANTPHTEFEFTAHWKAREYEVHFNEGTTTYKRVTYDQPIGELPVPEKEGWEFVGWSYKGSTVTENTVWNFADNSVELVARWTRLYTIKYVLTCTVRGNLVNCEITNSEEVKKLGLVKVSDYEYILENVREGAVIPAFPTVKPEDSNEYGFSSWKFGKTDQIKGKTIKAGDIVNESNFEGTKESGVITLTVHCYSFWTPFY